MSATLQGASAAGPSETPHDTAARVRMAVSGTAGLANLHALSTDRDVLVRAAVAINKACAPEVDRFLTQDGDERVRALLAGRLARLLPDLSGDEVSSAAAHVHETLFVLVRDEAVRVRVAVAEAVKAMPEAPHALVLQLAQDPAFTVSDPVVRLSPVLTDNDLLALLATPPHPSMAESIASREGVSAVVADAIATHADVPAVRVLLANQSACIQEATLDALVSQAAHHTEWHAPLVRRPSLSTQSARALSTLISTELLAFLAQRADLDPSLSAELQERVAVRIDALRPQSSGDEELLASLRRLKSGGTLPESALVDAARAGDHRRVAAILAVASGVTLQAVDRVSGLRNAKTLISLAWKGGFGMRAGVIAQAVLGQIAPSSMLAPSTNGGFPLSPEEMQWQIEVLNSTARDELCGSAAALR